MLFSQKMMRQGSTSQAAEKRDERVELAPLSGASV
jgi:hypothetical protein